VQVTKPAKQVPEQVQAPAQVQEAAQVVQLPDQARQTPMHLILKISQEQREMAELEQEQVIKPAKQVQEQVQAAAQVQEIVPVDQTGQAQEGLQATEAEQVPDQELVGAAVEAVLQPVLAEVINLKKNVYNHKRGVFKKESSSVLMVAYLHCYQ
jgi:hypothetical protein